MSTTHGKINAVRSIKADGEMAAKKVAFSRPMEVLARIGYGVRGLIYITMGLLAINVAFGKGGTPTDMQGAITIIGKQPAGLILLWIILVGLISYSLWGIIRAVFDPLHKGHDLKGLLARCGFLFSAASYGLLILPTYSLMMGVNRVTHGSQAQPFLASMMSTPAGIWAVGLIGLAVVAGGLHQIYQGYKASFDREFQTDALNAKELKWATQLGRFGTAARGLVFTLVGGLLCLAAYQSNARQSVGPDAALLTLMHQPYGLWLLGIVATGLIAFGIYSMLNIAWFRLHK